MIMVRALIEMMREMYKLRTCALALTEENVSRGKFKVCLQYHIGNCLGPCEDLQDEETYAQNIEEIKHILRETLELLFRAKKNI